MSKHYVPSTEDVRKAYCVGVGFNGIDELRQVASDFDRWLNQEREAKAWDEGWEACHRFVGLGVFPPEPNPYRQEQS